ncbi:YkvA family protein [Petroclostridium sp. X23]|uniref:YkvA family protein n=1 Tax=Petroclostridium sp. X23 TaxID=3045146 RepID=UPI0024AE766D|nr:YkvA family protein [Petroclostridium sp. X23]WHH60557.1 YkvA family protein [Petroclostridium sp. X23]
MEKFSDDMIEIIKRLPQYTKLLYKVFRSAGLKRGHRIMLYGAIGYAISPIDLIPGVVPVIGQLDDILVILTVLYKVISSYKEDKFAGLLSECNLTIDIVKNDIRMIKNYVKLMGISTAKIIAHGIKTVAEKGMHAIKNSRIN